MSLLDYCGSKSVSYDKIVELTEALHNYQYESGTASSKKTPIFNVITGFFWKGHPLVKMVCSHLEKFLPIMFLSADLDVISFFTHPGNASIACFFASYRRAVFTQKITPSRAPSSCVGMSLMSQFPTKHPASDVDFTRGYPYTSPDTIHSGDGHFIVCMVPPPPDGLISRICTSSPFRGLFDSPPYRIARYNYVFTSASLRVTELKLYATDSHDYLDGYFTPYYTGERDAFVPEFYKHMDLRVFFKVADLVSEHNMFPDVDYLLSVHSGLKSFSEFTAFRHEYVQRSGYAVFKTRDHSFMLKADYKVMLFAVLYVPGYADMVNLAWNGRFYFSPLDAVNASLVAIQKMYGLGEASPLVAPVRFKNDRVETTG